MQAKMKMCCEVSGSSEFTHLRIQLLYGKESDRRCYSLVCVPIKIEEELVNGVSYRTELFSAWSGFRMTLEGVQRASVKTQERLENEIETSIQERAGRVWEVASAVLEKHHLALKGGK